MQRYIFFPVFRKNGKNKFQQNKKLPLRDLVSKGGELMIFFYYYAFLCMLSTYCG